MKLLKLATSKTLLHLLLLLFASGNNFAQQLIPYRKDSKWGFCTTDKKIVVKPIYERVELYKNGFALVVSNNRLGMINTMGKEVIPCLYKDLHLIKQGLVMAKNEELLCGYIDSVNKVVIPFQYEYASDFYKGAACVKLKTGNCFLIDKKGKKISKMSGWAKTDQKQFMPFDTEVAECYLQTEEIPVVKGLSYVRKKNDKDEVKLFLTDKSGKVIGKKGYKDINLYLYKISNQPFIEVFDYDKGNLYGLIDRNGKELVPMQRSKFSDFYYGLAYNQTCIIDTTGKIILDSVSIYYASDRFVRVKFNDSIMRYYDLKRRDFFPGVFIWGTSVSNGIAFAETNDNQEISINMQTGKKKALTDLQKKLKKFNGDDALESPWRSGRIPVLSKMGFWFLNDSACFDRYYIVDHTGKPTGAIVHSYSKFMNSITDKNGNKKEELSFAYVAPGMFDIVIRDADMLIILNSTPLLRNEKNTITTDPISKRPVDSDQSVITDLNGTIIYEVNRDGAKVYNKKGEVINTFYCYTCDGTVLGSINHTVVHNKELNLFYTPMGYISLDFKTAYFED